MFFIIDNFNYFEDSGCDTKINYDDEGWLNLMIDQLDNGWPIIYRGYDSLGITPFPCPIEVAILVWEWGTYYTKEALEQGLDVKISTWARTVS